MSFKFHLHNYLATTREDEGEMCVSNSSRGSQLVGCKEVQGYCVDLWRVRVLDMKLFVIPMCLFEFVISAVLRSLRWAWLCVMPIICSTRVNNTWLEGLETLERHVSKLVLWEGGWEAGEYQLWLNLVVSKILTRSVEQCGASSLFVEGRQKGIWSLKADVDGPHRNLSIAQYTKNRQV